MCFNQFFLIQKCVFNVVRNHFDRVFFVQIWLNCRSCARSLYSARDSNPIKECCNWFSCLYIGKQEKSSLRGLLINNNSIKKRIIPSNNQPIPNNNKSIGMQLCIYKKEWINQVLCSVFFLSLFPFTFHFNYQKLPTCNGKEENK